MTADDPWGELVSTLCLRYPLFARATVARWVDDVRHRYDGARVTDYVPELVRREIEDRLSDLSGDGTAPVRPRRPAGGRTARLGPA